MVASWAVLREEFSLFMGRDFTGFLSACANNFGIKTGGVMPPLL
jgi:hypothetical protein